MLACSPAHAQPSTCPAGNKEPVKILSALHCTVKIHETSFRGCQIRRLSIAKTPIQEVFLRRSATRFLITRCPAQRHYSDFIIVLVIRHLVTIILAIHSFPDHYSLLLLILPGNKGWRMKNCYGDSRLFSFLLPSGRRIQYLLGRYFLDIARLLGHCGGGRCPPLIPQISLLTK